MRLGCEGCPDFEGLLDCHWGLLRPTVTFGADLAVLSFAVVVVTQFHV